MKAWCKSLPESVHASPLTFEINEMKHKKKEKSMDATFLPPIEKPQGLMMKLAY
jgi:hypothetical protein